MSAAFDAADGESARLTTRQVLYLYGAILAILVLVFSPFYLVDFAHYDDWNLFDPHFWETSPADEIRSGRFLYDRILHFTVFPIVTAYHSIAVLPYIRLANTVLLAVAATLLAVQLRQVRFSFFAAFCTSVLVFILPGGQQRISHAIAFSGVVAIVLGIGAGTFLTSIGASLLHPRSMSRRNWLAVSLSVLLLLLSCNAYQGSAMFFLLPIAVALLFGPEELRARIVLLFAQTGLFCAGLLLYFLSNKIIFIPLATKWLPTVANPAHGYYYFDLTSELLERLHWTIEDLIPLAARLWWFEAGYVGYVLIAAIIAGVLILSFWLRGREGNRRRVIVRYEPLLMFGFVFAGAILANAPYVMAPNGSGMFFRLLFPCSALLVLFLVWIGSELGRAATRGFRAILAGTVVVAGISAHVTVHDFATNSSVEVTIMQEAIGRLIQTHNAIKELYIVRPPDFPTYVGPGVFIFDEFNKPSTDSRGFAYLMVRVLGQTAVASWLQLGRLRVQPVFEPAYFDEDISGLDVESHDAACKSDLAYVHEGAVIADMAAPLYLAPKFMKQNLGSCVREFAYYDGSPEETRAQTSVRLFDNEKATTSYWETKPYPVALRFRYERLKTIKNYTLGASEDATKMPVSWRFEASSDDVTWTTLDVQQDVAGWLPDQKREFAVEKPGPYRFFRFIFTKGSDDIFRISTVALDVSSAEQEIGEPAQWTITWVGSDGVPVVKQVLPPIDGSFVETTANGKISVEMVYPNCRSFSQYRFWVGPYGADSTDRQPAEWTLFVRGGAEKWVQADSERVIDTDMNDRWYTYPLPADVGCIDHARWEIARARQGGIIRLFKFQLFEPAPPIGDSNPQ